MASKKNSPCRSRSSAPPSETVLSFDQRLQRAVAAIDVTGALTSPLQKSIENLLRIAARAVDSEAASVLVRDGTKGGLKFLVAIGAVAEQLLKVKIPAGKGIAGFVFSSGQSLAVADVGKTETFYAEVDKKVGFTTETLLATPLRVNDQIVGVLEFVNRTGFPPYEPFTPDEMDQAAHFADALATLVEAYESADLIESLFRRLLECEADDETCTHELRAWLKNLRRAPEHKELLSLALSVHALAVRGEAERKLCREMLDSLTRFVEGNTMHASYLNY